MWIKRQIESILSSAKQGLNLFPVWLLLGPRQVGKSSLLLQLAESERQVINLDQLEVRQRVTQDPILFSKTLKPPLMIDEIQYAPQLLSPLKIIADRNKKKAGIIWITGSQNFEVMRGVRETLAGRVAILNLFGLTDSEKQFKGISDPRSYFQSFFESNFPKIHQLRNGPGRDLFLSSYVQTYIERDVRELLGIQKRREFEVFVKLCALRVGQLVNYESLAKDVGVSPVTVKDWLGLLEDSYLIRLVHPYFQNRNRRLIKTPKLFFLDTGLACHLAGWKDVEVLLASPMAGAYFENHVLSNLFSYLRHEVREFGWNFWRVKEGKEIDCILEIGSKRFAIEVKMGQVSPQDLVHPKQLKGIKLDKGFVATLTAGAEPYPITEFWDILHPAHLPERILRALV